MRFIPTPWPTLALALLIAGCSAEPQPEAPTGPSVQEQQATSSPPPNASRPPRTSPTLVVEGEGLRLFDPRSGSARPLAFGLARTQVIKALEHRREATTGRNDECGAGPLEFTTWLDGLTLYFQHGRFVGWAIGGRGSDADASPEAVTTAAKIGLGSTRAELERAYDADIFSSSLGTEFSANNLFGVLDGEKASSRITAMWAGASCNMR